MTDDGIGGTLTAVSFYISRLAGTSALVCALCALVLANSLLVVWKSQSQFCCKFIVQAFGSRAGGRKGGGGSITARKREPSSGGFGCLTAEVWFSGLPICL